MKYLFIIVLLIGCSEKILKSKSSSKRLTVFRTADPKDSLSNRGLKKVTGETKVSWRKPAGEVTSAHLGRGKIQIADSGLANLLGKDGKGPHDSKFIVPRSGDQKYSYTAYSVRQKLLDLFKEWKEKKCPKSSSSCRIYFGWMADQNGNNRSLQSYFDRATSHPSPSTCITISMNDEKKYSEFVSMASKYDITHLSGGINVSRRLRRALKSINKKKDVLIYSTQVFQNHFCMCLRK